MLGVLLISNIFLVFLWKKYLPLFFIFALLVGCFYASWSFSRTPLYPDSWTLPTRSPSLFEGCLLQKTEQPEGVVLILELVHSLEDFQEVPLTGRMRLTLQQGRVSVEPGDCVRVRARIKRPTFYANPGYFDNLHFLRRQGIFYSAFIPDERWIIKVGKKDRFFLGSLIRFSRQRILQSLASLPSDPGLSLFYALGLGDRSHLTETTIKNFRQAGVAHILSISGQHIGLIALVFYYLFKGLLLFSYRLSVRFSPQKIAALATIFPVIFYTHLSGAAYAAIRAEIMVLCYLGGILMGRRRHLASSMALAALLILMGDPSALFDVSFQLSFAAVGSMALAFDVVQPKSNFGKIIITSIAAFLGTAPLVSHYFYQVPMLGVLANLVIFWPVSLLMPLVFVGLIGALLHPVLGVFLIQPALWVATLLSHLVDYLGTWGGKGVVNYSLSWGEVTVLYLLMFLAFGFYWRRQWVKTGIAVVAILVLLWAPWEGGRMGPPRMEVTFLDVGHGEATLVQTPSGHTILIDAGGTQRIRPDRDIRSSWNIGEKVIFPYLVRRRIHTIDLAIISHPDLDHYQGFLGLLEQLPIREFWINGMMPKEEEDYRRLLDEIRSKKIPLRFSRAGDAVEWGGVALDILFPKSIDSKESANNNSLVIRLKHQDVSLLITGDIEGVAEKRLTRHVQHLKSDVFQVPHHGSRTSSLVSFLRKVSPRYAVMSVGRQNAFGLPHPEVLRRYQEEGIRLYRTDQQGAILLRSDGKTIEFETVLEN